MLVNRDTYCCPLLYPLNEILQDDQIESGRYFSMLCLYLIQFLAGVEANELIMLVFIRSLITLSKKIKTVELCQLGLAFYIGTG